MQRTTLLPIALGCALLASCSGVASQRATCKVIIQSEPTDLAMLGRRVGDFAQRHGYRSVQLGVAQPPGTDIIGLGHPIVRYYEAAQPPHVIVFIYGLNGSDPQDVRRTADSLISEVNTLPNIPRIHLEVLQHRPFADDGSSCVMD
jgi:hypothetical protein